VLLAFLMVGLTAQGQAAPSISGIASPQTAGRRRRATRVA